MSAGLHFAGGVLEQRAGQRGVGRVDRLAQIDQERGLFDLGAVDAGIRGLVGDGGRVAAALEGEVGTHRGGENHRGQQYRQEGPTTRAGLHSAIPGRLMRSTVPPPGCEPTAMRPPYL